MIKFVLVLFLFSLPSHAGDISGLYAKAFGNPQNPAVVYLHGGPGYNSFSFEGSTAEKLAQAGYYVVVFDQRGCGRSQSSPIEKYTFANAVAEVQTIIDLFHLHRPLLVGHSYGGTLAVEYALRHPDAYSGILLVDAPLDQPETMKSILDHCETYYEKAQDKINLDWLHKLRSSIFTPAGYSIDYARGAYVFAHARLCKLYSPGTLTPEAHNLWQAMYHSSFGYLLSSSDRTPYRGLTQNENWLNLNLVPQLAHLHNVYGTFGSEDGLFSAEQEREMSAALPSGHTIVIPGASHTVYVDQQPAFLEFLERIPIGGR